MVLAAGGETIELLSAVHSWHFPGGIDVGSWPFSDRNSGGLGCCAASSVCGFILMVLNMKTSQPGVHQNPGMKKIQLFDVAKAVQREVLSRY